MVKLRYLLRGPPSEDAGAFRDRALATCERLLAGEGAASGYRVEESVPRGYERTWPDGADTPGGSMLTLLRRWHEGHSPLALEIHPLWNQVRNVVRAPVLPGSPPVCGIVEEQFRTREDLLDLAALENYLVTERWLRG
jgi:hypothetical protein